MKNSKHKAWRKTTPVPKGTPITRQIMKERHLKDHPNCTYGDEPHFVPPSFGQIGFFMCDPPADLRNHSRCQAPFDHEHPEHFDISMLKRRER